MSDAHKFTGDERDSESNLDHTQFRQYSSSLGRWMHPDPAGLAAVDPSNPQSWNRYAYVRNNPLALVDPFGLNECAPGEHDCNAGEGEGNPGQDILGGPPAPIEFGIDFGNFWDNQSHVGIGGGNFGSLAMLSVFQTYSVETDVTTTETNIDGSLGSDFLTYFLPTVSGGWPSPDPAGLAAVDPSNPQSWNRYPYVKNNPLNRVDPTGLNDCEEHADCENIGLGLGATGQPGQDLFGGQPLCDVLGCDPWDGRPTIGIGGGGRFDLMNIPLVIQAQGWIPWTPDSGVTGPEGPGVGDPLYYWGATTVQIGTGLDLWVPGILGRDNGGGGTVSATPKLTFKPPSWDNFTHEFLPCYGAELYNNFLGNDDRTWVTAGTVAALKLKNPWAAGAALVVWTGTNAFQAGSACAVSSRAVYQ
ncbi:MAG TPA: RHS repeat-associated core domain-containing protein [Candidatus Acidoferrum sp.]|nr:RHS repeat-associated core domain-containing protein [Candidatus Acidoferrum sp.]